MREELFAHLATSFEEELIHLGEEGAAAERAANRLGEAGELTRNLQDSVPWIERVMYTRLIPASRLETYWRRRQDESITHYATRTMIWMTASVAGADLVAVMVAVAGREKPVDWPVAAVWAAASLLVIAAGAFASPFLCEGMVRALEAESPRGYRPALFAVLSSLMVIALASGFVVMVSVGAGHGQVFQISDWLRLLSIALLAPFFLIMAAHDTMSWRRRRDGSGVSKIPS